MENLTNRFIHIYIDEKAMCKLQYYSEYAPDEVGGILEIDYNKKLLLVKDVIILKQKATGGDFHLDDDALAEYTESIFLKKPQKMKHIKGWWHKHGISGWSGHDDDTFESLREYFKGFVFGIVMRNTHLNNKKFSPLCRLEIGKGKVDDGNTQIIQFYTPHIKVIKNKKKFDKRKLRKKCKKEVEKFVEPDNRFTSQTYGVYSKDYEDYEDYNDDNIPYQGYQNKDLYEKDSVYSTKGPCTAEPSTDTSTSKILKKAGLVWDPDLGYYVHKDYYKGKFGRKKNKQNQQTTLTERIKPKRELSIDYDDMDDPDEHDDNFYNYKGEFAMIDGVQVELKREIDCTFDNIECKSCPYREDCIESIKERNYNSEKDSLNYLT